MEIKIDTFWFSEWEKAPREEKLEYWERAKAWIDESPSRRRWLATRRAFDQKNTLHMLAASFWSQEQYS